MHLLCGVELLGATMWSRGLLVRCAGHATCTALYGRVRHGPPRAACVVQQRGGSLNEAAADEALCYGMLVSGTLAVHLAVRCPCCCNCTETAVHGITRSSSMTD